MPARARRQQAAAPEGERPVHVGCSGWSYASWRQPVYGGAPATRRPGLAGLFDTVEVNTTFYRDEVYAQLERAGVALVVGDHPARPFQPLRLTAPWAYVRFHYGRRGRDGNYSGREIDEWADRIASLGVETWAYFNNDWSAFAVANAPRSCVPSPHPRRARPARRFAVADGGDDRPLPTSTADDRAERPLRTYSVLVALFVAVFGGIIGRAAARGRLPERPAPYDVLLAGVAGHKLSRIVAKEEVTAPVRAPFVETVTVGEGRAEELPSGSGPRRALGRLLTCPNCVGQWATAAFVSGLVVAPRVTRVTAAIFAADAVSDFLHVAYRAARERA